MASESEMGKPVAADLRQGIVTAPVLLAMTEFPKIRDCIGRSFSQPGDCDRVSLVAAARGRWFTD